MGANLLKKPIHLQDILFEKTTSYLQQDNPKTANVAKSIYNFFFKSQGNLGRETANNYFSHVISKYSDDELLKEVYSDLIGKKKRLGSSHGYKLRLMEGVCDYLNIRTIAEDDAQSFYRGLAQASTYGGPLPDLNDIRAVMLIKHIQERVEILMGLEHSHDVLFEL